MIRTFLRRAPRVHPTAFVHDSAEVIGDVVLGPKSSVWPGCVLRGDIEPIAVGEGTNVQDGTVIHTERGSPALLGRNITVGHRAVLHGCRVGDGCLIGMGAVVLETAVGRESLVGAGAMVPAGLRIPPRSLVLGVPAKVVRRLRPAELKGMRQNNRRYLRTADAHRRASKPVFPG